MNKKSRSLCIFDVVTIAAAVLVTAFVSLAMLTILIKGFPHIREAFYSREVIFAIKLSLYTASVSTVICIALAIPAAYALAKIDIPFKRFAQVIIEIPLSLPYLVLGLSLLLMFSTDFGKKLGELGLQIVFSKNGIIMAHILVNLPFVIRIVRTAFQEVDVRLEFIARMLGATKFKSFLTITLPLAKNTIIGAVILAWSRALGEFGATLMLVGATRMKTETLPSSIFLNMATGDLGAAMASAIILLIISAVSQFVFNRLTGKAEDNRVKGG